MRPQVDWERVEVKYRAGTLSVREIADEFGVSHTAINKRAKAHDWQRDLNARIRAKADAKVSAALVSGEVSSETKLTETIRVEIEAEVQARIRLSHREHVGKCRMVAANLLAELELLGDEEKLSVRTKILGDLAAASKTLIGLEREAYGLELAAAPVETPETIDPTDVARRMAFVFANAASRTIQ